jgi:hypothetical protein
MQFFIKSHGDFNIIPKRLQSDFPIPIAIYAHTVGFRISTVDGFFKWRCPFISDFVSSYHQHLAAVTCRWNSTHITKSYKETLIL